MNIKSLGVSVILLSLIFTQDIFSQIVFDDTVNGYSVIDCSGMPAGAVKTAAELAASKQSVAAGGRVLRHQQNNQQGTYITGTYGTVALYINQKISRKFAVQKSESAKMDWATASGWVLDANDEFTGDSKPAATGCAVYRGKDNADPLGSWRLPIQRELMVIYSLKGQLAMTTGFTAFSSSYYWSATELYGSDSWYVHFVHGYVLTSSKSNSDGVRCVRDL